MKLTQKELTKLKELLMIELSAEELALAEKEIEKAQEYIALVQAEKTGTEIVLGKKVGINDLREDVVKPSISNEEALKDAPDKKGGYFRVPKVVG